MKAAELIPMLIRQFTPELPVTDGSPDSKVDAREVVVRLVNQGNGRIGVRLRKSGK